MFGNFSQILPEEKMWLVGPSPCLCQVHDVCACQFVHVRSKSLSLLTFCFIFSFTPTRKVVARWSNFWGFLNISSSVKDDVSTLNRLVSFDMVLWLESEYTLTYMHTYVRAYIHAYIHTYIHTYTHTHNYF